MVYVNHVISLKCFFVCCPDPTTHFCFEAIYTDTLRKNTVTHNCEKQPENRHTECYITYIMCVTLNNGVKCA